ncbi:hypothetical protein Taro_019433 [Colocasia esculenta]|uniref:Uncharacterized protein n=1 Tax=Colocasia esculenta TaxID=4460 RepID=A0A843UWA8_COLES|nr:hypothetical protein [Colocasia esculenta]
MPPHGIDYWFMMPVSNPNNTAQERPLSPTVTDVRSNCRSTTTSKAKELWRPTKPPRPTVGRQLSPRARVSRKTTRPRR